MWQHNLYRHPVCGVLLYIVDPQPIYICPKLKDGKFRKKRCNRIVEKAFDPCMIVTIVNMYDAVQSFILGARWLEEVVICVHLKWHTPSISIQWSNPQPLSSRRKRMTEFSLLFYLFMINTCAPWQTLTFFPFGLKHQQGSCSQENAYTLTVGWLDLVTILVHYCVKKRQKRITFFSLSKYGSSTAGKRI